MRGHPAASRRTAGYLVAFQRRGGGCRRTPQAEATPQRAAFRAALRALARRRAFAFPGFRPVL